MAIKAKKMHILQLNSICSPATITISSHAYFFARAWLGATESTEQRLKRVSESFWSHVKNRNVQPPHYIIKDAATVQMWRTNPPPPASPSHFNHWITLYGFHIYIFFDACLLGSSIICIKLGHHLTPAIKPTGVMLIVRHKGESWSEMLDDILLL